MSTIWIVCQESEQRKTARVAAFHHKEEAAFDAASRMTAAPEGVWFWLEIVEMANPRDE